MRQLAVKATCTMACALVVLGTSSAAFAQSTAAPKNLRVTGVTDWSVTLTWEAPKGKAPSAYVVQCSNGRVMTVAGSQRTARFTDGFDYNRTYSFRVFAVSSSGAWSSASNTVTATLLNDTTPAATPVVSSTGFGPTHVDVAWSYADVDPSPRFDIYVNGQLWYGQVGGTSKRIVFLSPGTSYTFRVRARDSAGNWSPLSEPLVLTTPAADVSDREPPTSPPGLWGGVIDGATEAMVFWGNSEDNVTAPEHPVLLVLEREVRRRDRRPLPASVQHVPDTRHREHDRGVCRRRGRKPLDRGKADDRSDERIVDFTIVERQVTQAIKGSIAAFARVAS
jgi:chitodextrinase